LEIQIGAIFAGIRGNLNAVEICCRNTRVADRPLKTDEDWAALSILIATCDDNPPKIMGNK